jgi:hemerythrin-like domain-containing protein
MNIIDAMLGEHAALRTFFNFVEQSSSRWALARWRAAAETMEALLRTHSVLEDELFFDALTAGHSGVQDTLEAMREEHTSLRGMFARLSGVKTAKEFRRCMTELIDHTREHFAVEERVLFRLAGEKLGTENLTRLGKEWARRRQLNLECF